MPSPWKSGFDFWSFTGLLVVWSFHNPGSGSQCSFPSVPGHHSKQVILQCAVLLSLRLCIKCIQCPFLLSISSRCGFTGPTFITSCRACVCAMLTEHGTLWELTVEQAGLQQKNRVLVRLVILPRAGNCPNCHLSLCVELGFGDSVGAFIMLECLLLNHWRSSREGRQGWPGEASYILREQWSLLCSAAGSAWQIDVPLNCTLASLKSQLICS